MESRPFVSIILINYNGSKDTIECVESLLRINYTNFMIFILDNGSSTKLEAKYFEDSRVFVVRSEKNLGFSGGNNYSIEYVKEKYQPDYYCLLNNDTIVDENFLKELVFTAEDGKSVGIVSGKIMLYSNRNEFWFAGGFVNWKSCETYHFGALEIDEGQYDKDIDINFATGCLWLIPAHVVDEVGKMQEDYFLYYEDTDYCCRIIEKGYRIIYCHNAIIYHKVNGSTGKINNLERYYMTRNGFILVKRFGTNKVCGYSAHIWMMVKDILKRRMNLKIAFIAFYDFTHKCYGKKNRNYLHRRKMK